MVAREHEEEQTQRSMLALNKLKLMVVGKTAEEAEKDIAKVRADKSMIYYNNHYIMECIQHTSFT